MSGARRRVQHGARDRYRLERRNAEENGVAPEHRRGQGQGRKHAAVRRSRTSHPVLGRQ